ncbi:MAG: trypsin-like peptidase domain-containing protein [Oscillospiraceae bacterium]|nr:trypsin-like peptidase domain-containing protein [Oscillospiraceae bacterium]
MENQWYESNPNGTGWSDPGSPSVPAKPKKRRMGAGITALLILFCALLLIAVTSIVFAARGSKTEGELPEEPFTGEDFASDFREFFEQYYTPFEESKECTIPRVASFPGLELELRETRGTAMSLRYVYEKCAPSVVAITAFVEEDSDDSYFWGSGIVMSRDGYILTNAHVIEGSCRARVTLWDDREYDALLVGYDHRSDIAVLKIDAEDLIPAEFCTTDGLGVGDSVVAIGNPLGKEFRSTMTEGIISGIDRGISYNGTTMTLIQTSAPINEGNSGGPLFNLRGQVVGITNMKMSANYIGSVTIEGVGFAIPSPTIKTMADSILRCGEVVGRPALGLTVGAIPAAAKTEYDLPDGLYVSAVSAGSDCEAKGILPGDILLAMNGEALSDTEQITSVIKDMNVGDTVDFTIWREADGATTTFDVTVALVDVNDVY